MKIKDKKIKLLQALNAYRFDGKYYDVLEILQRFGPSSRDEAFNIAKSLDDGRLIKMIASKDGAHAEITTEGVEFLEEDESASEVYEPADKFHSHEKEAMMKKLDELSDKLERIEVGQQITYDDLMDEIETLKKLLDVLGKKDWGQILKGKLVDAGFGEIVSEVIDLIIDTFKDSKLLGE